MSIDRSLRPAEALVRHRNVLKRGERLEMLKEQEKWSEKKSVFGLPKVGHRKAHEVKVAKAAAATTDAAAAGTPAAAAPAAAPAAKANVKPAGNAKAPAPKAPAKK